MKSSKTCLIKTRNVRNRFFYFGSVVEKLPIRFGVSSVRSKKTQFSSAIIVIYYSCNSIMVLRSLKSCMPETTMTMS